MLGSFACLFLLIFTKNERFQKQSFRDTIRVSNSLDPDQDQQIVGSGFGPNCLQRLSALMRLQVACLVPPLTYQPMSS